MAAPEPEAPSRQAPEQAGSWGDRHRDDVVVVAMFVAARLVYIAVLGVRMDLVFLGFAPHLPDLGLLQHHLLQTVWYEHTQPPLFPFGVGLLLKLSPFPDGITFQIVYLAMGVTLALVLRRIGRLMGMGRVATFVGIGFVVTNPGLVSIEFSANYDQPTILLIAVLVLWTGRYVVSGRTVDLARLATVGATLILLRTVFHPVWYLLLVGGLVLLRKPLTFDRRTIAVLLLPGAVVLAFVAKNQLLFGEATLTTWAGPSLSKIAGSTATAEERKQLIADGTVSPIFGRHIFWGLEEYDDAMPPCTPTHTDIPVLADRVRPTNQSPNLNDECFLPIYRQQGTDARHYLAARPGKFLGGQVAGGQMFFEPTLPIVFTRNQTKLAGAETFFRWTLYPRLWLQPIAYTEFGQLRVLAWGGVPLLPTILLLDVAVVAAGTVAAVRLVKGRSRTGGGLRRARLGVWAAIGLTSAWVTVIGSAFEINENARYRLLIEPYLLLTMAWAGERAVRWVRTRLADQPASRRSSAEVVRQT